MQIKRKLDGSYTTLAEVRKSRPTTGAWHRLRFDAIGNRLDVYIDGTKVLTATDGTFSWGTAGIRTDGGLGDDRSVDGEVKCAVFPYKNFR